MIINKKIFYLFLLIFTAAYFYGCFPASRTEDDDKESAEQKNQQDEADNNDITELNEAGHALIIRTAAAEQNKKMYSPSVDSTYLYWLNNQLVLLNGSTKCNIFALNVLHKSGFKTPKTNALCRDLYDTSKFSDIFPVVNVNEISGIALGDLIIWKGHVIIFEKIIDSKKDTYVQAWWAGTRQKDNGDNIKNNVIYGKYKISGNFVVRRPIKK
jgi:hypothetical protein